MQNWTDRRHLFIAGIILSAILFVVFAPVPFESYNTLNQRGFLDLITKGNPFSLAGSEQLSFQGRTWALDWPYPPSTILLLLPAWAAYQSTGSEYLYQLLFKLPLFASAVITQILVSRWLSEPSGSQQRGLFPQFFVLSPAVFLLTTILGGFDIIAAMLILLAYYFHSKERLSASAIALGLAAVLRFYPAVLIPLFAFTIRKTSLSSGRRAAASYLLLSLIPLALTCVPFILLDREGFFHVMGHQAMFGPVATVNFATPVFRAIIRPLGYQPDFQSVGYSLIVLLIPALLGVYWWALGRRVSLAASSLVALLVFFLFYPKVHGLYMVSFLPLALIQSSGLARWVWIPGFLWMVLVNGAFGATGFLYWLGPLTGKWSRTLPESLDIPITILVAGMQALMLIIAIAYMVRIEAQQASAMESAAKQLCCE